MSELAIKDTDARKRLVSLFDDGVFTEIDAFAKSSNGDVEVVAGFGTVNGAPVYAFSQDVSVNGGAVSVAQCAKIKKIYDLASKTGCPVVGVYDSNGMDLKEGFEGLSAYGEIVKASTSVSGVVPQISIVAGAAVGTTALIADMADVVVAVKDADFYVTAPSEVTAEACAQEGTVDILADDFDSAVKAVRDIITLVPSNNLSTPPVYDFTDPAAAADTGACAADIIKAASDEGSVIELKEKYAENCITALATVAGSTVGFVGFDGKSVCPSCAYKAEAFVKFCDAFNIPIVTLLSANGLRKERENQMLIAAAKLTAAYATATCPKISVITGKAVGAAYIMLAGRGSNADLVYAWDTSVVSPLDTKAAVAFLYNDRLANGENRAELEKEYEENLASPFTAAACGAIDDVFVPAETRAKIVAALDVLAGKRETTLPRKHSVK
ncbi:MAG TPA: carboxyl transferase [Candidatus Eubacterium faecale]|uniref:Carboxyl transferase n=1 Tax=Candidatus Eubacterium faecale TaxID=2838568 RepID=A0A9D2MHR0_9FIRM|nr:carboxyl transferase [Candidatus Eubacterium faecale]